jgi:hypothetical protein
MRSHEETERTEAAIGRAEKSWRTWESSLEVEKIRLLAEISDSLRTIAANAASWVEKELE